MLLHALHAITCPANRLVPARARRWDMVGVASAIWNPVHLNVNRQIGTYWSVLVRTSLYQYQQVQDFPDWYKQVQDGTRQYQIS